MRITWLADVLRDAGLTVVEHPGWRDHYRPGDWTPQYGIVHATAAPRSQSDETQVSIVRDGRSDLQGPIANACVDRRGRWHVLSAGRCNTTLVGTAGPYKGKGNTYGLGVEACNDNRDEPWPPVQYDSYVRGWAAIARRLGWDPSHLRGHKEHTPGRKSDPTFSMAEFRANVARVLAGEDDGMDQAEFNKLMTGAEKTLQGIIMRATDSAGRSVNNNLVTGWNRLDYLANKSAGEIKALVVEVLQEVSDDPDVTIVVDEQTAELVAEKVAQKVVIPTPQAVADELRDRLAE